VQDLEVLGPSGRLLGPNDIGEIGDHDLNRADPHPVSPSYELVVPTGETSLKRTAYE